MFVISNIQRIYISDCSARACELAPKHEQKMARRGAACALPTSNVGRAEPLPETFSRAASRSPPSRLAPERASGSHAARAAWETSNGSLHHSRAAKLQLELQKLLWRPSVATCGCESLGGDARAPLGPRFFSQEDQKDRRRELGFALPPAVWCGVARRMAGRAIKPSFLVIFL
jgi:hypothetical protein